MTNALSNRQKYSYGVGHVLNDLCASMWFSYLLVFFHKILKFSNSMAGNILLVGQIADGLATPFVGFESDRSNIQCAYGRRKSWHLVGSVCVMLTFPLLFIRCVGCDLNTPETSQFVYYAPLVIIFQFGWASTQINHLALIPDLASSDGDKVTLNAIRYAFTVFSSILVYALAWIFLDQSASSNGELSPKDASSFRNLVLTVVGCGVLFSVVFHIGLKEKKLPHLAEGYEPISDDGETVDDGDQLNEKSSLLHSNGSSLNNIETETDQPDPTACTSVCVLHWYEWFRKMAFYQMALLYMCTRLVVNLSQVYIPMYLTDTLKLHKSYIAIVPLVTYVSSFLATTLVRPISNVVKQEVMYIGGCMFVFGACIWAHFLQEKSLQVFGLAVVLGIGTSIVLVMSLSMTAKLIGKQTSTGAFVYGAMSLTDKISNGVAVVTIQYLNPCLCQCPKCAAYFRFIMSYLIGSIMLIALITVITKLFTKNNINSHVMVNEDITSNNATIT